MWTVVVYQPMSMREFDFNFKNIKRNLIGLLTETLTTRFISDLDL